MREPAHMIPVARPSLGEEEAAAAREREAEEQRRREENAQARQRYLDQLQAEREARRQEDAAKIDAELEPVKQREKRRWLADHPDMRARDFEERAWPRLKANILEERREAEQERLKQAMRASGQYSL
jgi:hypothetical protein